MIFAPITRLTCKETKRWLPCLSFTTLNSHQLQLALFNVWLFYVLFWLLFSTSAPIETGTRSTITVFPDGAVCSALDGSYDITIPLGPTNGRLRWDFIPDGSTRRRRLSLLNSRNVLSLSTCDVGGLYIVFRKDRKKLGWAQYIRVIVSGKQKKYFSV